MNTVVQVKDKKFALYIHEDKIKARVKEVAAQIDEDLKKKNPLFLVLLNGSFVFAADLLRDINFPCEISFVKMSSYEGTTSTGQVRQLIGLNENVTGRTVVIVEDIIESGTTMKALLRMLGEKQPKEVFITSLFVKPGLRAFHRWQRQPCPADGGSSPEWGRSNENRSRYCSGSLPVFSDPRCRNPTGRKSAGVFPHRRWCCSY